MKVDAPLYSFDAPEEEVRRLEAKGYAGAFTYEGPHDPFFPLLLAARASERIALYTAVAIGFARNPMIQCALLKQVSRPLLRVTKGRLPFVLFRRVTRQTSENKRGRRKHAGTRANRYRRWTEFQ